MKKIRFIGCITACLLGLSLSSSAHLNVRVYIDTVRDEAGSYSVQENTEYSSSGPNDAPYNCRVTNVKTYYKNGQIKEVYAKKNNDFIIGDYRSYFPNGRLEKTFTCIDGVKVDFYVEYYDDGSVKVAGTYKILDQSPKFEYVSDSTYVHDATSAPHWAIVTHPKDKDIKDGTWSYFERGGALIKKELWQRGKLVK